MRLIWTSQLATGVAWQDAQHKELFTKINELIDATTTNKDAVDLTSLVGFLDKYVRQHFGEEERAMARHGYVDIAGHRSEHKKFIEDIARIKTEVAQRNRTGAMNLRKRLAEWFYVHVGKEDKTLGSFFLERGEPRSNAA